MSIVDRLRQLVPGDAIGTITTFVQDAFGAVRERISPSDHPALPTVDQVDLERYCGLWYEMARLPMRFQPDDTLSTAEYTRRDDGAIGVHNVAYEGTEVSSDISGTATPAAGAERDNSRLVVRFGGLLKLIPVPADGNYYILRLADDYSMALVGTPDRNSLWLLAREPTTVDEAAVADYLATAESLGFDTTPMLHADWEHRTIRAADGSSGTW